MGAGSTASAVVSIGGGCARRVWGVDGGPAFRFVAWFALRIGLVALCLATVADLRFMSLT
jgi:hypothetical protein